MNIEIGKVYQLELQQKGFPFKLVVAVRDDRWVSFRSAREDNTFAPAKQMHRRWFEQKVIAGPYEKNAIPFDTLRRGGEMLKLQKRSPVYNEDFDYRVVNTPVLIRHNGSKDWDVFVMYGKEEFSIAIEVRSLGEACEAAQKYIEEKFDDR